LEELPELVEINEGRELVAEPDAIISRMQSRRTVESEARGRRLAKMMGSGRAAGVRNRKAAITNFQTLL
jgi:hypothetical protein